MLSAAGFTFLFAFKTGRRPWITSPAFGFSTDFIQLFLGETSRLVTKSLADNTNPPSKTSEDGGLGTSVAVGQKSDTMQNSLSESREREEMAQRNEPAQTRPTSDSGAVLEMSGKGSKRTEEE